MVRASLMAIATLVSLAGAALAQTGNDGEMTPQQKVRGGVVRERAPGNIINQARARHREFIDIRVNKPRNGEPIESATTGGSNSSSGGSSTGGSLDSLLGSLGSSGLLGSLSSLTGGAIDLNTLNQLSGALNGSGGGSSSTAGNSSSSSNPNIPSNIPPDVVQSLVDAGFDLNELFPPNGQSSKSVVAGAVESADSKIGARSQQTNDPNDQPTFLNRWANALLTTTFSAIVLGFSSPSFVDWLTEQLRPIFLPESIESTTDNNTGGGTNGAGGGNSGNNGSIVRVRPSGAPLLI